MHTSLGNSSKHLLRADAESRVQLRYSWKCQAYSVRVLASFRSINAGTNAGICLRLNVRIVSIVHSQLLR
jgi:hypothetical protein